MQVLRKITLAVAVPLFVTALFMVGLAWSVYHVVHTPHNIKEALDSSGIYTQAVPELLQHAGQDSQPQGGVNTRDIPVAQPEIRNIIAQAFPPQFLQTQTEGALDAIYNWLNGATPQLQFTVRLSDAKQNLAAGMEQYVRDRLNALPVCTPAEMPSGDINPYTAACVPAGVDKNVIAATVRQQVLDSDSLKDTTIDATSIKDENGKPLDVQMDGVPAAYDGMKASVFWGALAVAVLAAGVVFLSATWRGGARRISIVAIVVGVLSALLALLSNFAVHTLVRKGLEARAGDTPLQPQLLNIGQSLADDFRNWWVIYGAGLVVLGVAALLALHFTMPKNAIDMRGLPAKRPRGDAPDLTQDNAAAPPSGRHEHRVEPPRHNNNPDQPNTH